ncbi:hypothetical protein [Thalassococcus sp. S3]|uniref:hypothetical protein n=1 Tax=Thalassococcus sp. S3 TaxID=2017482 RepID=UPI00102446DA|nr:hypothetical protein [Thalassococcus sp. S3]QBF33646.1 hypothetical protein CFI11_20860 [Thalassococcus sp. S3]
MTLQDDLLSMVQTRLDPKAQAYAGGEAGLPERWAGYASASSAERLFAARAEMDVLERYLPEAAENLAKVIVDVALIESPTYGTCRVFARQIGGKIYPAWSRLPKKHADTRHVAVWTLFAERAPQVLKWLHTDLMDGLTDLYQFGGFKSSAFLTTMEREIDTYAEQAWFDDFANQNNISEIVEVLASGGGGYLLLDLSEDRTADLNPMAWFVDVKSPGEPERVPLYAYLDTWLTISLTE